MLQHVFDEELQDGCDGSQQLLLEHAQHSFLAPMLHPQVDNPSKVLDTAVFINKIVNPRSFPPHIPHDHQLHQVEAYHHSSDDHSQAY